MENLNLHKQKLYALILAGVALISLFLPWLTFSYGVYGGGASVNGLRSWGLLALLGVGAVAAAVFMEDKTKAFAGNARMIALGGFGAMVLAGVIWFIRLSSFGGGLGSVGVKSGFGVYLCIVAGILGLLWVYGIIKLPDTTSKPPAPPTPPTV